METSPPPADLTGRTIAASIARDVVHVSGPDATSYLQGQLSQDVARLDVGDSAWSFLLQPTGRVDAWLRVTRTAEDTFALDLDAGCGAGDAVAARLRRFLLRTKAEITLAVDQPGIAVRGPGAAEVRVAGEVTLGPLPAGWPGVAGFDVLGPDLAADGSVAATIDTSDLVALRIAAGVPAMGAELTEDTIPAEAGQWVVDASVSFTKGCYTGQELVARIDSRGGNVPRPVRRLRVGEPGAADLLSAALVPGAAVHDAAGGEVGVVTSAAGPVALAVIARTVAVGSTVQVGDASARVDSVEPGEAVAEPA